MHVAVFLQHYHTPDCATAARPHALVAALAARHDVTLVTTDAWRARRLARTTPWVPPGVRLVELRVPYANRMTARQRLASFARYAAGSFARGVRLPARPDVVVASSTPLTTAVVGALVARRYGVPWVFEVRDLWPAFPIQMGAVPGRVLPRLLVAAEHALYRDAARIVALSPDMAAHVQAVPGAAPVTTNVYGADLARLDAVTGADVAALRRAYDLGTEGRLVLYAGSFGRANAIPTLLGAARRLAHRPDARFVFAGDGFHRPDVARAAAAQPNVRLLPPLPMPQALALFRAADLSLASFLDRPVLAANAPGKFFDSLAAGTPVVVTNDGWTRAFVERHGCGWYVPPECPAALAARVAACLDDPAALAAAGRRAAATAAARFDRRRLVARLVRTVETTTARA